MGEAIFLMHGGLKILKSISITTNPTKMKYSTRSGSSFNTNGMVITARYSNGSTAAVTGYTCSPTSWSSTGDKTVTITYTEGNVTATATLSGITVIEATTTITFSTVNQSTTGKGVTTTSKSIPTDYQSFVKAVFSWQITETGSSNSQYVNAVTGNYVISEWINNSTQVTISDAPFGTGGGRNNVYGKVTSGTKTDSTSRTATKIGLHFNKKIAQVLNFSLGGSVVLTTAY